MMLAVVLLALVLPATATHAQDRVVNDGTLDASPAACATAPDDTSIQAAVNNAASGNTILVCPGVYAEEVNVSKPLTINGPYAGTGFDGQSTDRGNEAIVQPPNGFTAAFHIGASDVTIDGFTLDGDNNGDGDPDAFFGINNFDTAAGVYETVTNFTVANNVVRDFQGYGVFICNGTQNCTGDRSEAGTGMTTGGVLRNNRFDGIDGISTTDGDPFDFAGRAVSMETDGIIETVVDNVIRNVSPATGQNQYGVQTGNQGRESDASALTITIERNDIIVDDLPIWVNNHDGDVPSVNVSSNTVDGKEGIRLLNLNLAQGLTADGNTIVADTLGMRVVGLTTGAGSVVISGNELTFPGGQEYDGNDSGTTEGDDLGEQVIGMQVSQIGGTTGPVFRDNVFGTPGSTSGGPFYAYALFDVQADARTIFEQTVPGATINGVQQGLFVANTDMATAAGSFWQASGLVMDNFTGESPNDAVNFHAGIFVFTLPDAPNPVDGLVTGVTVRNTGIAGSTSAPPSGCSPSTPSGCGGQASAGLYFGDFGSTATVRQTTEVQETVLDGNDNRGIFLRGQGAQATVTQSTLTGNGDAPFTAGGNFGFSAIARNDGVLTLTNSFVTGPASVSTSGNPDDNQLLQSSAGGQISIEQSAIDRNGVGTYAGGAVDAPLNAWRDGGTTLVNPGATGASISADYSPFLNQPDTDAAASGVQADVSDLTADSGSPDVQSATKIEEAAGLGGETRIRLVRTGGQFDVPADVSVPGDLVIADDVEFGTVSGAIQVINAELVVEPGVSSITNSPTFDVQRRFTGTDGSGSGTTLGADAGWRILATPRANTTSDAFSNLQSPSSGSILYTWDGATQEFTAKPPGSAGTVESGRAFFLYLFDIDDPITSTLPDGCSAGDACVGVSGPLDLGPSFPSTSAFGTADVPVSIAAGDATDGYVLGVPYAQSFDLSSLTIDGGPIGSAGEFEATVQAWDPQLEQFVAITEDPGTSDQLAPWQGFWVLRRSSTTQQAETLTFASGGRASDAPFIPALDALEAEPVEVSRIAVDLTVEDDATGERDRSRAVLYARTGASLGEDAYDASRIAPPKSAYAQVSFATAEGVRKLQSSVPYDLTGTAEVPLHVEAAGLSGTAQLSVPAGLALPDGWTLTITDHADGTTHPLDPGDVYTFDLDGGPAVGPALRGRQTDRVEPQFTLNVASGQPLPVEFAALNGFADGQTAVLEWATASETNNTGFRVQQQVDGQFQTIDAVGGAGTTTELTRYRVEVPGLDYGTHVFRLMQVDTDGTRQPSTHVPVTVRMTDAYEMGEVSPNPVAGEAGFTVRVRETQNVTIDVYDVLGRRVHRVHGGPLAPGTDHLMNVQARDLSSGTYFVRMQGETGAEVRRFTVVR